MAWSVIEGSIRHRVDELWQERGRSKTARKRIVSGSSAHHTDVLEAAGQLTAEDSTELGQLRSTRNKIVHDLGSANEEELAHCIALALRLAQVPGPDGALEHRVIFL